MTLVRNTHSNTNKHKNSNAFTGSSYQKGPLKYILTLESGNIV